VSKATKDVAAFFKKKSPKKSKGFNLLPNVNSFSSVFDLHELSPKEAQEIEELLPTGDGAHELMDRARDVETIKNITAEVKSISKQGVILIGERVARARTILKKYGDGQTPFTTWLTATFGSRRTAYNLLSYFELYTALPTITLKDKMKALPLKAAYALASRQGELSEKAAIIAEYNGEKPAIFIEQLREKMPLKTTDRRASKEKVRLDALEKAVNNITKAPLSSEGVKRLRQILSQLT